MKKTAHGYIGTIALILGITVGGALMHSRVRAAARLQPARARTTTMSGRLWAGNDVWKEINGRVVPPLGTNSALPWKGTDAAGNERDVGAYICFESVNYLLTGDAT